MRFLRRFFQRYARRLESPAQEVYKASREGGESALDSLTPPSKAPLDSRLESLLDSALDSPIDSLALLESTAESPRESRGDSTTKSPSPLESSLDFQAPLPNAKAHERDTRTSLTELRRKIEREKALLPFDLLGRSLSYNPYPPRFKELYPSLDSPRGLLVRGFAFSQLESILARGADIIVLDMARDSRANPSGEGLECLGYLRHYSPALLLLKDCFLDPYQILQAVVYGADGIVLNRNSSGQKELLALAFKLNLMSLSEVVEAREVTRAVLARSEGFFIEEGYFSEVASLIPRGKCLCHYRARDLAATLGRGFPCFDL